MFHKRFFLLHSFHLIVYIWLCFKILSHIPYTSEICKTKAFGTSVLEKEQYKVHLIYLRHLPISSFSITYLFAPIYVFSFTFSILIHKQSTLFVHSMLLVRCGDVLVPIQREENIHNKALQYKNRVEPSLQCICTLAMYGTFFYYCCETVNEKKLVFSSSEYK